MLDGFSMYRTRYTSPFVFPKETPSIGKRIREYCVAIIFFSFLGAPFVWAFFSFYYVDPMNGCLIRVKRFVPNGDRASIKQALDTIKEKTPETFQDICHYVDVIDEQGCSVADPRIRPEVVAKAQQKGCYVKGTKTVYVSPLFKGVSDRVEVISRFGLASKSFWEGEQE